MVVTPSTRFASRRAAHCRRASVAACILVMLWGAVYAEDRQVRVGVLTRGSPDEAMLLWPPTMQYLTEAIPGHIFQLKPLDFEELGPAVARSEVDFVLTNSGLYVQLEMRYGISRIATLKKQYAGNIYTTKFGGVVLVRADRTDLRELADLRNKHFMAVDEQSFGGWSMALRELQAEGVDRADLA